MKVVRGRRGVRYEVGEGRGGRGGEGEMKVVRGGGGIKVVRGRRDEVGEGEEGSEV